MWRFSQHHLGRRGPERYGGGGDLRQRRWVVVNNKITMEEGQLITVLITRWVVVNNKITMEEEGRSLLEGFTPEGWFFLKNSKKMFRKSESEK